MTNIIYTTLDNRIFRKVILKKIKDSVIEQDVKDREFISNWNSKTKEERLQFCEEMMTRNSFQEGYNKANQYKEDIKAMPGKGFIAMKKGVSNMIDNIIGEKKDGKN
jgi:hypothetical protein